MTTRSVFSGPQNAANSGEVPDTALKDMVSRLALINDNLAGPEFSENRVLVKDADANSLA